MAMSELAAPPAAVPVPRGRLCGMPGATELALAAQGRVTPLRRFLPVVGVVQTVTNEAAAELGCAAGATEAARGLPWPAGARAELWRVLDAVQTVCRVLAEDAAPLAGALLGAGWVFCLAPPLPLGRSSNSGRTASPA